MRIYGISQVKDKRYAAAAVLTYWVFKCRDRSRSPAMGTTTWTYLESSIKNSAEVSTSIEDYLQYLCDRLQSCLRPRVLTEIIQPRQRILRINEDGTELQEMDNDQNLIFVGWHDLLTDIAIDGFNEWDLLEICKSRSSIIQVLCRIRFEEDRALNQDTPDDILEVEAINA